MSAVVPHGAKERSAGGMRPLARYLGPRWFSLPQSSRSCRARGAPFSLAGGWRSCRRFSLFPPLRFTSARVLRLRRPSLSARQRRVRISALCIRRAPWCKPRVRTPCRARSSFVVFGSLRRLFVVSRSCRARVASSSLSLLALRGIVVARTLSATRPPNAGNRHAAQRRAGCGVLARGFGVHVAPPATGHWPAPLLPAVARLKGYAFAWTRAWC